MEVMTKTELRKVYKELRKHVTFRAEKEKAIEDKLMAKISGAKTVFCYESLVGEVSTAGIIGRASEFAEVFVPEVDGQNMLMRSLKSGEYATAPCDVTVVPLIAFDETLNRLGFGGGYYDRFLASVKTYAVGIAFDEQQCDVFVRDIHDIPLDMIITPTRILQIK